MELNHSNHKHFSFDLWLTLIKSNPEFKHKRNLLFKNYFEINHSIEKITTTIRYYDVLCNNTNEKTGLNIDTYEIYYLILNALDVNLDNIGIEQLSEFYKETEFLFLENKPLLIDPKIEVLFKEITKQEKTINILSNTGFIKGFTLKKLMLHYELENYFSFQIYSDEVRISKPNNKIFELVYDETKKIKPLDKKEILHIGDNKIADYDGAIKFGFDALLIKK